MTQEEIQAMLRDLDRFLRTFRAIEPLRDLAQKYSQFHEEVGTIQREKADIEAAHAKAVHSYNKSVAEHASKTAKLQADFDEKKRAITKLSTEAFVEHNNRIQSLEIARETAEKAARTAEEKSNARIAELNARVESEEAKAKDAIAKIAAAVTVKQKEYDDLKANLDSFLQVHHLKKTE